MAPSERASLFRYGVTRPYPFSWFTPVAVTGLIVLVVLLSFLNFASIGYNFVLQESSNPNTTVEHDVWMRHWPSLLARKVQPTCQSVDIPVGSELFTNQTALTYILTDVWQPQSGGSGAGNGIAPSLTYYNNVLENCTITSVEIDYSALDRTATQVAYSEWGAVLRSCATCSVLGINGTTFLNLTQEYDYVPPTVSMANLYQFLGTNFLTRNAISRASLYWGESLMSMFWAYSTRTMQDIRMNQTNSNQPAIRKGTLYFYPNTNQTVTDITNLGFFEVDFRFMVDYGLGNYSLIAPNSNGQYETYTNLTNLVGEAIYPNIWEQADSLAKSAYSTVLADLGSTVSPNIVTDPDLLSYFTSNFSDIRHQISNAWPGPAVQASGTVDSGDLGTTPSVIDTRYLCQVPQRRAGGNLFVAILVADLVLLQAIWLLFKAVIGATLLKQRPDTNHCEGCERTAASAAYHDVLPVDRQDITDGVELGSMKPSRRSSESRARSISEERLISPKSMDLGYRA